MTHLRIWRARVDLSRLSEYERFIAEHSQPMFAAQRGFRGVIFSRAAEEVVVLSGWGDTDALAALDTSETYQQSVRALSAKGVLAADPKVEVFEIHAGVLHRDQMPVVPVDAMTTNRCGAGRM